MKKEICVGIVNDLYSKIYDYTDIGGDSVLELMDDVLEQNGKYDMLMHFIEEDPAFDEYTEDQYAELVEAMRIALEEIEEEFE